MTLVSAVRHRCWQGVLILGLSFLLWMTSFPAWASPNPQQDLQVLDHYIDQAIAQAENYDLSASQIAYQHFDQGWEDIEQGIKARSRLAYRDIETAMGAVTLTLAETPVQRTDVVTALKQLHRTNQTFINSGEAQENLEPSSTAPAVSIRTLINHLDQAEVALNHQDVVAATQAMTEFQTDWVEVEGSIAAKSHDAYVSIENAMAKAAALLRTNQGTEAQAVIAGLQHLLQPFAAESLRYTLFDAAAILLREGMEALLVIVALLAVLTKSGHQGQSRWIWLGAGAGLLASLAIAVLIQVVFANLTLGTNRELLEGVTGLIAATMLFYVSYWLHSKVSLGSWQGYIQTQTSAALATNNVISLALLAGLAVFREGAETILFYIGIAPSISTTDLLGGLGLALVALGAIAGLIFGLGLRLPLTPFFWVSSGLIYYLGFKFVGNGIHALQVAGLLPATTSPYLPTLDSLGLYPTWQTTVPQVLVLMAAIAVVLYPYLKAALAPQTDP